MRRDHRLRTDNVLKKISLGNPEDELLFEAWFQDDEYEGRALSIVVVNIETDAEIIRQLYQFDSQNPVKNQFMGGHGFTGLNYVFKPKATDEIQYYCSVE